MALNVLVVDDSATVRSVIAKTLRLAEVPINELHEAANGEEALVVLKEHWIDLVFSDLNMPVMDGLALVERMSSDELLQAIPIIIVSTEGSSTRIEELMLKGISGFIRKPFTPEQVREMIDSVLGGGLHGTEQ